MVGRPWVGLRMLVNVWKAVLTALSAREYTWTMRAPREPGPVKPAVSGDTTFSHETSPKATDGGRVLASLCVCGSNQTAAARLPDVRDQ